MPLGTSVRDDRSTAKGFAGSRSQNRNRNWNRNGTGYLSTWILVGMSNALSWSKERKESHELERVGQEGQALQYCRFTFKYSTRRMVANVNYFSVMEDKYKLS